MKRTAIVIGACALSSFAVLNAQETDESQETAGVPTPHQEDVLRNIGDDLLGRLDQDGDGSISRQEAQAEPSISDKWSEYDQNSDGMLDHQEVAAIDQSSVSSDASDEFAVAEGQVTEEGLPASPHQREVIGDQLLVEMDKDGDGKLSQQEAEADSKLTTEWARLDSNQDGSLDAEELSEFEQ